MAGRTLNEMQALLPPNTRQKKFSTGARKFVARLVPSPAYFFGVPALILRSDPLADAIEDYEPPPSVAVLSNCARRGFGRAEMAALAQLLAKAGLARRALHRHFALVVPFLPSAKQAGSWQDMVDRVERASDRELNNRGAGFEALE